jgi:hypothetical protein
MLTGIFGEFDGSISWEGTCLKYYIAFMEQMLDTRFWMLA